MTLQLPPRSALRDLNLAHCGSLAEVSIVSERLRELHLGGCSSLRRVDLRCASLRCSSLTSLSLDAELHHAHHGVL